MNLTEFVIVLKAVKANDLCVYRFYKWQEKVCTQEGDVKPMSLLAIEIYGYTIEIYGYRYIAADWTGFLSCFYDSVPPQSPAAAIANFYNAKV